MFSHEQLASILSTLPDPAFILTRSGRYAALFGGIDDRYYHDGSGLIGQTMFDVLQLEKANWFAEQIAIALDTRALHIVEYTLSGSDVQGLEGTGPDHPIWFEGRVRALEFKVDGEDAVVWVASNITEKNVIQQRLRALSETDDLTGLFNRRKLMEDLGRWYERFEREGTPTAVLMFDVDNFKGINDRFGHYVGDCVLSEIGRVCRAVSGREEVMARLGGDEFVILMPGKTCEGAARVAEDLRLRIAEDIRAGLSISISVSGGLSEFWREDASSENVLKRADHGLYESKRNGRNRISAVYDDVWPPRNAVGF